MFYIFYEITLAEEQWEIFRVDIEFYYICSRHISHIEFYPYK